MTGDPAEIADRLVAISDELADLAIGRLQEAAERLRAGGEPDPALAASERRITRARRAVDKAAGLLAEATEAAEAAEPVEP